MRRSKLNIIDNMALARLPDNAKSFVEHTYGDWIRTLRIRLRMTQTELAQRAKVTQAQLVHIESGKTDPQVSTLKRIFEALSCQLVLEPRPKKPLDEILRGRARSLALKRLKKTAGTMALEGQAPDEDVFRQLLEKQTDEILADPRAKLWDKMDE